MIQTKVVNNSPQPQNVVFDVQIPKGAFISNFSMWVTPSYTEEKLETLHPRNQLEWIFMVNCSGVLTLRAVDPLDVKGHCEMGPNNSFLIKDIRICEGLAFHV